MTCIIYYKKVIIEFLFSLFFLEKMLRDWMSIFTSIIFSCLFFPFTLMSSSIWKRKVVLKCWIKYTCNARNIFFFEATFLSHKNARLCKSENTNVKQKIVNII